MYEKGIYYVKELVIGKWVMMHTKFNQCYELEIDVLS